jgi:hypothetical protein
MLVAMLNSPFTGQCDHLGSLAAQPRKSVLDEIRIDMALCLRLSNLRSDL